MSGPEEAGGGTEAPVVRTPWATLRRAPAWLLAGPARYVVIFALDLAAIATAFGLAYLVTFEGRVPPPYRAQLAALLPLLLGLRLPLHFAFGIHRWSYRLSGLHEAMRVVLACAAGTAAFVAACRAFLEVPPPAVVVLELLLTASLVGALRFSPRLAHRWYLRRVGPLHGARHRVLIANAGPTGESFVRDIARADSPLYDIVGFLDDDSLKWRTSIGGCPVLGPIDRLPEIAADREIDEVFFAPPQPPPDRLRQILEACAHLRLSYKTLPAYSPGLKDRALMERLEALAPENLLQRRAVTFDPAETRALVSGRRVLVTGAAGSIGGEISRQAAGAGPSRLILVDLDENGLYLLARRLQASHPGVAVEAAVADVCEALEMRRIFEEHRPQDVLHAAAHKQVPMMEPLPARAVRNNVTGCRVVAELSAETGVERFVLISTDKAVEPVSVMGASKRLAELVVQQVGAGAAGHFATVRFGNVLGSAGSVVPLFKEQIARGGPVTVTDPGCRRYFMTIHEAVGLVLVAGLSRLGSLCILEMGEPMRVLDLARLMITLAGHVPDGDVRIELTGLRPGEKLDERLTTDAEAARSRSWRDAVRVVDAPPLDTDSKTSILAIEAAAAAGASEEVIAGLRSLLPDYRPSPRWRAAPGVAVDARPSEPSAP